MPRKRKVKHTEGVFERKKGSGKWYARWYDEFGTDRKKSVGTKTSAEEYLTKVKEEVRKRKLGLKPSVRDQERQRLTVADLLERYWPEFAGQKSARVAKTYSEAWKRDLGRMSAHEVTAHDILQWQREQELKGLEGGTINRYTSHIRKVFNLAIRDYLMETNPCGNGRVPAKKEGAPRDRVVTLEEERALLAELSPIDRSAYIVCCYSGMRQSEALGLKRPDVDFQAKMARLHDPKAGKPQTVNLSAPVLEALEFAASQHDSQLFFPGRNGKPMSGKQLTVRLKAAAEKLGFEGILWHTLRHTFVTRAGRGGVDIDTLQGLARHATIVQTSRYFHSGNDARQGAVEQLATEYLGDQPLFPSAPARRGHLRALG